MATSPAPTLTITRPDGQPQAMSFIPLPPTAAELASLLNFLPPEVDIPQVPTNSPPSRPQVTAADKKPLTIKEIMANMRRKVEADIERNKERRRAEFWDKKKQRVPTDELVAGGLVKKMK
ncbi:hypothetical protein FMUND_1939 [Fusarium mundagurra]|uniref:Uncharacterized protein n=1 Tax=Fusarium mundagurra TaxID=1567541 RepID=A0A8H5Z210_9HYPO|nr:hypothetical protein FMUND_1939 [Fusarium mundagurra]